MICGNVVGVIQKGILTKWGTEKETTRIGGNVLPRRSKGEEAEPIPPNQKGNPRKACALFWVPLGQKTQYPKNEPMWGPS